MRLPSIKPEGEQPDTVLAQLIVRCASRDQAAMHALYDAESSRLHGLALRITREPGLAADAVHDAFIQVWQQAMRFDPARGGASAWLTSLLRYRAIDICRRRRREQLGYEPSEQADTEPDPLARLQTTSESMVLRHCLELLDEMRRRLVLLAFEEGLSHSELAARLNQPLGTVKSNIRRALSSLKRCLGA